MQEDQRVLVFSIHESLIFIPSCKICCVFDSFRKTSGRPGPQRRSRISVPRVSLGVSVFRKVNVNYALNRENCKIIRFYKFPNLHISVHYNINYHRNWIHNTCIRYDYINVHSYWYIFFTQQLHYMEAENKYVHTCASSIVNLEMKLFFFQFVFHFDQNTVISFFLNQKIRGKTFRCRLS